MTLPTSGSISSDQFLAELRVKTAGRNYPLSLDDADVLALAGKTAPPVTMPDDFYGKSVAPPEMTLEAFGDTGSKSSTAADGVVSCFPSVIVRNGKSPYTYLWEFTNNPLTFTITNANTSSPTISKAFNKNTNGSATATLRVTVTDSQGQTKVANNVMALLQWSSNA